MKTCSCCTDSSARKSNDCLRAIIQLERFLSSPEPSPILPIQAVASSGISGIKHMHVPEERSNTFTTFNPRSMLLMRIPGPISDDLEPTQHLPNGEKSNDFSQNHAHSYQVLCTNIPNPVKQVLRSRFWCCA